MSDDAPSGQEEQSLDLFSVRVPAKTVQNVKKAVSFLTMPFWSDFKELTHAHLQKWIARARLSRAQIEEQIRQLPHGTELLQKGLSDLAEDQQRVDETVRRTLQILGEKYGEGEHIEEATAQYHAHSDAADTIRTSWLRRYKKEVEVLGSDDMEEVFARVLAEEIEQPNSFSIQTLRVLGTLDQQTAKAFRTAVSLALIHAKDNDPPRAFLYYPCEDISKDGTVLYGLSYEILNLLTENGLLAAEYNAQWRNLGRHSDKFHYKCQGRDWLLFVDPTAQFDKRRLDLARLSPVALFTKVGRELMRIVEIEEHPGFIANLQSALSRHDPPLILHPFNS